MSPKWTILPNIENLPYKFQKMGVPYVTSFGLIQNWKTKSEEGLDMGVKTVVTLYVVSQFLKVLPTQFKKNENNE